MSTVAVNDPVLTLTPEHTASIGRAVDAMRSESDYPFTIETLAEITNFSPFHFARLFRSLIGIPPGEFLTALRYDRAKQLLLTSDLSVTDICFEVGYDSLGTFSTRFKQLVGIGPAGFRALPDLMSALAIAPPSGASAIGRENGTIASIHGHFINPPPEYNVYVGLFPASIARGRPVAGTRVAANEPFTLGDLPRGQYRLLCAAVPAGQSQTRHLLPGAELQVASHPDLITIDTGIEHLDVTLSMRALGPTDPPVLIALPTLDLHCPNVLAAARPRDRKRASSLLQATGD